MKKLILGLITALGLMSGAHAAGGDTDAAEPRQHRRRREGAAGMSERKTAIVVAPGRGTYGKGELGSIARLHGARFGELIAALRRA